MALKLLFITPRIDESHDDLAFASLWAKAFADAGYDVQVICGIKGTHTLPFPVYEVGGKQGKHRLQTFLRFQKLIMRLKYDRVFVHLGQRWLGAGAWWWWLRGIPTYLWYTHYTNPISLRIGYRMIKRSFSATDSSLPQYEDNPKKIVTGHGIDTRYWDVPELPTVERLSEKQLLAVHRIARSKRLHIALKALALLPSEYTLTHYGRSQDPNNPDEMKYDDELQTMIRELGLEGRVKFMGAIPMSELRNIYPRYQTFINMVPKTIDKTVLEAMYCGLNPVVTREHAEAIGLKNAPRNESPEAVADYILNMPVLSRGELRRIVASNHSLASLVETMSKYIRDGI
jgi:glycosyltransferase involved in cell wall biosynthesis